MLRIYELKVKAMSGEKAIPRKLLEKLPQRGRGLSLVRWSVVKSSVDARVKGSIKMVSYLENQRRRRYNRRGSELRHQRMPYRTRATRIR